MIFEYNNLGMINIIYYLYIFLFLFNVGMIKPLKPLGIAMMFEGSLTLKKYNQTRQIKYNSPSWNLCDDPI